MVVAVAVAKAGISVGVAVGVGVGLGWSNRMAPAASPAVQITRIVISAPIHGQGIRREMGSSSLS